MDADNDARAAAPSASAATGSTAGDIPLAPTRTVSSRIGLRVRRLSTNERINEILEVSLDAMLSPEQGDLFVDVARR